MATIKERVYRKNASGTYDTIHYETSADLVLMPDGTKLSDYKVVHIGTKAPRSTNILWIDTNSNMGLKYHNGSSWVPVPVMYT